MTPGFGGVFCRICWCSRFSSSSSPTRVHESWVSDLGCVFGVSLLHSWEGSGGSAFLRGTILSIVLSVPLLATSISQLLFSCARLSAKVGSFSLVLSFSMPSMMNRACPFRYLSFVSMVRVDSDVVDFMVDLVSIFLVSRFVASLLVLLRDHLPLPRICCIIPP